MKFLLGMIVLFALVIGGMYQFGGYFNFDATQQGKDIRAKLGPGMTHKQVFDITGNPRKYQVIQRKAKKFGGQEIESFIPGPINIFKRERYDERIAENSMPHGSLATFHYSESQAFTVTFDGTGTVTFIEKAGTMSDFLQMPED